MLSVTNITKARSSLTRDFSVLIYGVSHGKEFCSVKGEIAHSSIQKEDTLSAAAAAAQQRLRVRGHLLCYLLSLKLGRHLSKHHLRNMYYICAKMHR